MLALSNAASGSPWPPILGDDGEGSREEGKGKVEGGMWKGEKSEGASSIFLKRTVEGILKGQAFIGQ